MTNRVFTTKRWVVFRLGHLGDVVLSTGVLNYLYGSHSWTFVFVTKEAWKDVFSGNPCVKEVESLRGADLESRRFWGFCRDLAVKYQGWGLLDLHGNLRSRLLAQAWKGPVLRYPKMSLQRRLFLASKKYAKAPCYQQLLRATNVTQRYAMAVDAVPPPVAELLPRIWLSKEEISQASVRLASLFGPDKQPVALHPYATHHLKAWPKAHWLRLVELMDAAGTPWLALGKGAPLFPSRREDLTNLTDLRESCAVLSLCRSLVSGDSGPMHLATAVQTPVVALFGPTTREWGFYPAGPRDIVLETPLSCRPCSLHGKSPCNRNGECLASLTSERVFSAIEQAGVRV